MYARPEDAEIIDRTLYVSITGENRCANSDTVTALICLMLYMLVITHMMVLVVLFCFVFLVFQLEAVEQQSAY
jgi:hypothetical protein